MLYTWSIIFYHHNASTQLHKMCAHLLSLSTMHVHAAYAQIQAYTQTWKQNFKQPFYFNNFYIIKLFECVCMQACGCTHTNSEYIFCFHKCRKWERAWRAETHKNKEQGYVKKVLVHDSTVSAHYSQHSIFKS